MLRGYSLHAVVVSTSKMTIIHHLYIWLVLLVAPQ